MRTAVHAIAPALLALALVNCSSAPIEPSEVSSAALSNVTVEPVPLTLPSARPGFYTFKTLNDYLGTFRAPPPPGVDFSRDWVLVFVAQGQGVVPSFHSVEAYTGLDGRPHVAVVTKSATAHSACTTLSRETVQVAVKIPRQPATADVSQMTWEVTRDCPEADLAPPATLVGAVWYRRNPAARPSMAWLPNAIRFSNERDASGKYRFLGFNYDGAGNIVRRFEGTYGVKTSIYNDGYLVEIDGARLFPRFAGGSMTLALDQAGAGTYEAGPSVCQADADCALMPFPKLPFDGQVTCATDPPNRAGMSLDVTRRPIVPRNRCEFVRTASADYRDGFPAGFEHGLVGALPEGAWFHAAIYDPNFADDIKIELRMSFSLEEASRYSRIVATLFDRGGQAVVPHAPHGSVGLSRAKE